MHTYACIHVGEVAFQGPPTRQCSLCGFVFACAFYNLFGASVTLINLLAMFRLSCYGFPCLANGSLLGAPYFQRAAKPSEKCHDKWVCFHMVKFLVPFFVITHLLETICLFARSVNPFARNGLSTC